MLSATSTEVVKATLPAIGAAIGDITPQFYSKMFAAHPELLRDTFNRGNQAVGDQPKALAGSIARYATLLVADDAPQPIELLSRIAHKHASLGITEAQYAIVHEHLFAAIVEVLGEAVTPEVAAAWDEVYWLDGPRPHHPRAGPVRRGRRRARGGLARPGGLQAVPGLPRHRLLRAAPGRRLAAADWAARASTSPSASPCPTVRDRSVSTA